jgi:hypothetical protein
MTRFTLVTAGQCRARGCNTTRCLNRVRGTDPDDSLYPCDRWSVPRTRLQYDFVLDPRARHWSATGRIKHVGLDQCHARYTDPACVALTPMTRFTLVTAGQCRARGCNYDAVLEPRARHWSATGRIKHVGLDQCHARYTDPACVALTTLTRFTLVIVGQCRARGCNTALCLNRVRGTGQQPVGSSTLVLTSATHATPIQRAWH